MRGAGIIETQCGWNYVKNDLCPFGAWSLMGAEGQMEQGRWDQDDGTARGAKNASQNSL